MYYKYWEAIEKYPFIECSVPLGPGWANLFETTCKSLSLKLNENTPNPLRIIRVVERDGRMRIYPRTATSLIWDIIEGAEIRSKYICEYCGSKNNVIPISEGYKVACENCRNREYDDPYEAFWGDEFKILRNGQQEITEFECMYCSHTWSSGQLPQHTDGCPQKPHSRFY